MATKTPVLRRHRRSGHAYARLNGQQVWFGPYDDPQTHERFTRQLAEWKANGGRLPDPDARDSLTVADVVARYLEFAERFYSGPDGRPTREVEHLREAVRPVLDVYGTLPANDFGLRQLKTIREQLVDRGLARRTINDRVNRVVRIFRWAIEEELCRAEVYEGLRALTPLRRGRSRAKEGRRVTPVAWEQVAAVLPHVSTPVAGMIELMWHTGMRPGEACQCAPQRLVFQVALAAQPTRIASPRPRRGQRRRDVRDRRSGPRAHCFHPRPVRRVNGGSGRRSLPYPSSRESIPRGGLPGGCWRRRRCRAGLDAR